MGSRSDSGRCGEFVGVSPLAADGRFEPEPDALLDKDALFAAAWPGMIVEDNTLQVHMSSLRKALGTGFIATVHGRGCKYVGPRPHDGAVAGPTAPLSAEARGNIAGYLTNCVARETEAAKIGALIDQHRLV